MSELKLAKAIRATFAVTGAVLKWLAIAFAVVGVGVGLWAWANAHFLSFGIVIGIVVALLLVGIIITLWEWSNETIDEAAKEERHAQERNRIEKLRKENPNLYTPSFDDDFDPTDLLREYR